MDEAGVIDFAAKRREMLKKKRKEALQQGLEDAIRSEVKAERSRFNIGFVVNELNDVFEAEGWRATEVFQKLVEECVERVKTHLQYDLSLEMDVIEGVVRVVRAVAESCYSGFLGQDDVPQTEGSGAGGKRGRIVFEIPPERKEKPEFE